MKRRRNGSTAKQYAYAMRSLGGENKTKKERALASGFSQSVAENAKYAIEKTGGYNNAMAVLASETGNLVLEIYHVMKNRMADETTRDKITYDQLLESVSVMSRAWDTFVPKAGKESGDNPLKAILLQEVKPVESQAQEIKPL